METNIIYNKSCEKMEEVDDNSVGLIVTSPPYNVSKQYGEYNDNKSLQEYLNFIEVVFRECYRVLKDGCRIVINIADTGRQPYIPLQVYYTNILEKIGFFNKGVIIWDKGASAPKRTSWGSWCSSANAGLRDVHEFILVFSKGHLRKDKGISTITKEEFLCYTESIWKMMATTTKTSGHPAAYPFELSNRVIKLYSYLDDIVLDCFMGSGTTAISAKNLGRKYIGYELENKYCELANNKLQLLDKEIKG